MNTNYKRTLLGYSPNEVNEKINQLEMKFEEELNGYNKELSVSIEKNNTLKQELEEINLEMESYKKLKEKLQEVLYSSFIEDFSKIYDSEKMLNEMIKYKTHILETQEKKESEINLSINKLLERIECILAE